MAVQRLFKGPRRSGDVRFVTKEPLWRQPPVPWSLQVGAVGLWCGLAALLLYGLALALPYPWYEVGWLSFPPGALALALGLFAVAAAPGFQKALGLGAVAAAGLFGLVLGLT